MFAARVVRWVVCMMVSLHILYCMTNRRSSSMDDIAFFLVITYSNTATLLLLCGIFAKKPKDLDGFTRFLINCYGTRSKVRFTSDTQSRISVRLKHI